MFLQSLGNTGLYVVENNLRADQQQLESWVASYGLEAIMGHWCK